MPPAETVSFLGFRVAPSRIEADPEKARAVAEWPQPSVQHKLQQFLGFAHFYRRFIPNCYTIDKFIVEVDASDAGMGAVLSQCADDVKMHPCAFFSQPKRGITI